MTRDEATAVVKSILGGIAPEVDLARVKPNADLRDELDIDSMDFLRAVVAIHERLGVDVPEKDYPRIRTLESLVGYVVDRTAQAPAPRRTGAAD